LHNFRVVQEFYNNYKKSIIDTKLSDNETMIDKWYFQVGRSAVEVIVASCLASNIQKVERVLDLPCGHGRVLRHLVHLFPGAKFDACDLDMGGVDFCATTFGANAIYSRPDLTEVNFCAMYDVIWVGSLFTHTSEDITRRWMAHLAKYLNPNGIVVATLHGRWSEHVNKVAPYTSPERWQKILDRYYSHGYGYCDYIQEESHDFISGNYGISLIKPHIMIKIIEEIPGVRIFLYNERAWGDHQDVVAFGRPAFDLPWSPGEVG
jgi:SAM-dependent methyltransferase